MTGRDFFIFSLIMAMANGIMSPLVLAVAVLNPIWFPGLVLPATEGVVIYLSSLIVSTATLLLAGIPAALFEQFTNREETDKTAGIIWFIGTLVLSLPTLLAA
ncbi:MAG TPA: hypothetical protein DFI00_09995 [Rhodospirillaceae bacterium]|nr:hypothetical protein [Alphaproteobacteria bacterium]OUT39512.1 MAG: hypothetical protein CBB62_14175 [Micavibrio sp. TMED2]HCI47614.1 hypothetical protein [Rhodospirillaceae bacterium]MAS48899.1 hypothetical protein [Alphaproteobacteria bacterium]MAX94237.1 hypothetical protein [Alphaproteobacteria bacterium]|tara:strand:+ start:6619 stop:6927 length:309 start_codon:yes stop_codon:yes gene_type:complete